MSKCNVHIELPVARPSQWGEREGGGGGSWGGGGGGFLVPLFLK